MSGGGSTQTVTERADPWAPIQPHLLDIARQSQALSRRPIQHFPGETVAGFTPEQMAAFDMTTQRALAGSPVTSAAQQSLASTLSGDYLAGTPGTDVYGQAAQGQLANPHAQTMAGLMGRSNVALPVASDISLAGFQDPSGQFWQNQAAGGMGNANAGMLRDIYAGQGPGLDNLAATARGDFVGSNPYLDDVGRRIRRDVSEDINSTFSRAGMFGSGEHAQELGEGLGDALANLYGGAYESERGRQLGAAGQLSGLRSGAAGQLAGLGEAALGRQIQGAQQLTQGGLADISTRLQGAGLAGQLGGQDMARDVGLAQGLAGVGAQDINTQLAGGRGLADAFNQARTDQMRGLAFAPQISGLDYADMAQLQKVGAQQQGMDQAQIDADMSRFNFEQMEPWQRLQNYNAMIQGFGGLGGTATMESPLYQNRGAGILGGALGGAGLASTLGGSIPALGFLGGPWGMAASLIGGGLLGGGLF